MPMALEGLKVLDLASVWAGPSASVYLADQGAEVIKVEPPEGDEARRLFTHPALGNESPSFLVVNRNKRGVTLDIRKPEGLEIVHKLARRTDVLIHNFRPKAAKRLGLSYEDLEPQNPRLVYIQLSAWGTKGPYGERPGYELLVQALSGMMRQPATGGPPVAVGIAAADCSTPIGLAYGIALALLVRERTGHGQKVESSLLEMALAMQHVYLVRPENEPRSERAPTGQAVFSPYRCADGGWLVPFAVSDKEWARMCRVLEIPHLVDDPDFATSQARAAHSAELFPILEAIYATRPRDEWLGLLQDGDVPCAPVLSKEDVFDHPQITENEMIIDVPHPTAGHTQMIGVPVKLSANPPRIRYPSPLQGQHNEEVLEELGYDAEAIEKLRQAGVIPP